MGKLILCVLLLIGILAYGRYSLSEDQLQPWLQNTEYEVLQLGSKGCDAFDAKVESIIYAEAIQGKWEIEAGKAELCGFFKSMASEFLIFQAPYQNKISDFKVDSYGFLWRSVRVNYVNTTTFSALKFLNYKSICQNQVDISHGFTGYKITKYHTECHLTEPEINHEQLDNMAAFVSDPSL